MRFIILFLIISFVSPAFAQDNVQKNSGHEKTSYTDNAHDSGVCLNVFLKEDSEKKNKADDKATFLTAELIDFSFLTTVLTQYHSRADWDISNMRVKQEQLFKLNCNFLI